MTARESLEAACFHPDFMEIQGMNNVRVDLRYGTTRNLLGRDVYQGFQKVILHKRAGDKFLVAASILAEKFPQLSFLVFDALRPQSAQREFWDLVVGTPQEAYFANPAKGSIHSFGFAIDLSLVDSSGSELDMGTEFDDLSELAEPRKEMEFLLDRKLTEAQIENRLKLRQVMEQAGFLQLPSEWWHFDAFAPALVRATYKIVA